MHTSHLTLFIASVIHGTSETEAQRGAPGYQECSLPHQVQWLVLQETTILHIHVLILVLLVFFFLSMLRRLAELTHQVESSVKEVSSLQGQFSSSLSNNLKERELAIKLKEDQLKSKLVRFSTI